MRNNRLRTGLFLSLTLSCASAFAELLSFDVTELDKIEYWLRGDGYRSFVTATQDYDGLELFLKTTTAITDGERAFLFWKIHWLSSYYDLHSRMHIVVPEKLVSISVLNDRRKIEILSAALLISKEEIKKRRRAFDPERVWKLVQYGDRDRYWLLWHFFSASSVGDLRTAVKTELFLLNRNKNVQPPTEDTFLEAYSHAQNGFIVHLEETLDQHVFPVDRAFEIGPGVPKRATLLGAAIDGHQLQVVKYLLVNQKARIDIPTHRIYERTRTSPLAHAVRVSCEHEMDLSIIRYLLGRGAVSTLVGDSSPLIEAAKCGHIEALSLLIGKGASIDETNTAGMAPLHFACQYHQPEFVEALVVAGADIFQRTDDETSALDFARDQARARSDDRIVRMLTQYGAR